MQGRAMTSAYLTVDSVRRLSNEETLQSKSSLFPERVHASGNHDSHPDEYHDAHRNQEP